MYLGCVRMVLQHYDLCSTFCVGGHTSIKIWASENYTRWLVTNVGGCTQVIVLRHHCLWVQEFQKKFKQHLGFECAHQLWLYTPLHLHSYESKCIICRYPPPPKVWGKKPKSSTKVTLTSHQWGYSISSIAFSIAERISRSIYVPDGWWNM